MLESEKESDKIKTTISQTGDLVFIPTTAACSASVTHRAFLTSLLRHSFDRKGSVENTYKA